MLQADELITVRPKLPQNGGQSTVNFKLHLVGSVTGDLSDHFRDAASDHARDAAAARGPDDPGEVDVATEWSAGDDQLAGLREGCRRFVAEMNELGHAIPRLMYWRTRRRYHILRRFVEAVTA